MKGVTPIISIVILVLIAVALSGVAWSFLQGYVDPQVTKAFTIPTGGAYCESFDDAGTFKHRVVVYIVHAGQDSDLNSGDFIAIRLDDLNIIEDYPSDITLQPLLPGQSDKLFEHVFDPEEPGQHTIYLATVSMAKTLIFNCP